MRPDLTLAIVVGVLFGCGVVLLLERSLSRVLLGTILLTNGANLLVLLGGRSGGAPILGVTPGPRMSDPLAQAMVLTAIVITLGLTAFLLAMAYRNWQLSGHDKVRDDPEDRRIVQRAERHELAGPDDNTGEDPQPSSGRTADLDPEQVDPEPAPRRLGTGTDGT
ncbi:Na(+)/H(+) antiporter subunit C [Plantactinospora sp. WMMC1484]|uniref:Na(+)/H(+) antiporter subunit C n=1 Tax=Plantactinospora sp. WMMC1484 TaxID=3404122 RepID=UPI003BF5EA3C